MSEPHDPANENPEPGDVHAQPKALKAAFQDQAGAKPMKSRWADPDLSLLKTGFDDAVPFPVQVLGPFLQTWVEPSARAAYAPVDYTAGILLATVGALLGNVRWPNVEGVWEHPSVLWIGLVGNPSTTKSPGNRKDACAILVEAGLLYWKPEREGTTKGREREEYRVNARVIFLQEPAAADVAPQMEPSEEAA